MQDVVGAAWRHVDARAGFEVVFLRREADGYRVDGHVTAVEDGVAWSVRYAVTLAADWTTRLAEVSCRSEAGERHVTLESDGSGGWLVDGAPAAHVAGCPDVDLESSAFTNTFPVNRLALAVGERADAPAVYVRAPDLRVERLEQRYTRLEDEGGRSRYDYASPAFDFRAVLSYDADGLVLDYPGIAIRVL
jgi:hypothetical protein